MWRFQSKLPPNNSAEEHLDWMIRELRPHKNSIALVAKEYDVKLSIYGIYYHSNPEVWLEPRILEEIAELGAKLWIDTYCFNREYFASQVQRQQFKEALKLSDAAKSLGIKTSEERKAAITALTALEEVSRFLINDSLPDSWLDQYDIYGREEMIENAPEKLTKLADLIMNSKFYVK